MLAIIFAAALGVAPQAGGPPPALVSAETCLREKVGDAVSAASSASDAADFLLTYLCAGPVDRAATWQRNTRMLETVRGMFDDLKEVQTEFAPALSQADDDEAPVEIDHDGITNRLFDGLDGVAVDPVTGDLVIPDGADGIGASMLRTQTRGADYLMGDQRPVFLRELAGQLVLAARGRR